MTLKKLSLKQQPKKTILAVGAHPDDIDIGCSGTAAKYISEGSEVYYLILTDGSKGSEDSKISNKELAKIRRVEQQKAADMLGVTKVFFLDFVDGELENTHALKKEIVKVIRQVKPTTVICWDPTVYYDENHQMVNHPDHRIGAEAVLDSVYPFARNARTYPNLLCEGLEPHVVEELLLINFSKANYFVDISDTINKKITALGFHKSQFKNVVQVGTMIRKMNQMAGGKAKPKMKYAEGFVRITLRQPS